MKASQPALVKVSHSSHRFSYGKELALTNHICDIAYNLLSLFVLVIGRKWCNTSYHKEIVTQKHRNTVNTNTHASALVLSPLIRR